MTDQELLDRAALGVAVAVANAGRAGGVESFDAVPPVPQQRPAPADIGPYCGRPADWPHPLGCYVPPADPGPYVGRHRDPLDRRAPIRKKR